MFIFRIFVLCLFSLSGLVVADEPSVKSVEFSSGPIQKTVLELYTSEGCHSCPRADRFISNFATTDDPFKDIIPLAFHVDYWDYIGWEDRFANPKYSMRQRQLVRDGYLSQVYTPGLVVNSKEWQQWFRGVKKVPESSINAGNLTAALTEGKLAVEYSGHPNIEGPYELNIAYLGMGLSSQVTAGENRNKRLEHDYVVLDHIRAQPEQSKWNKTLANIPQVGQTHSAIAVWVTQPDSLRILQAAATILPDESMNIPPSR